MRNSLYNGKATKWLRAASESAEFVRATGYSLDRKTMRDREVINRFCAFHLLGHGEYKRADMDSFLGRTLEHMNDSTDGELADLITKFKHSMNMNYQIFGEHAFRKSLAENDPNHRRSPINVSLFDVCSVLLAALPSKLEKSQQRQVGKIIRDLILDDKFGFAITYSTNSTKQVSDRFEMAEKSLEGVI